MRGLSAEGLAGSVERVEALASAGDAERLGTQLFAVAGVLMHEASLRRAMTDPSAAAGARSGLAGSVFTGKVDEATVEAVSATAAARWSSAADFVDALEMLGVLAIAIDAEKAGHLDELEDELFRFGRVVSGDPRLRDAVTNQQVPVANREVLVSGLLEGKVTSSTIKLAVQAVDARHRSFEAAIEAYQKVVADRQNQLVAVVRSATELTEDQRERLAAALGRQYGHQVHLNVVVDPGVLGGISVEIGDDVIDGTVAGRLDDARRRMAG